MHRTNIVFLLGLAGCGKDTIGALLVQNHNFTRVSFADAVKDDVAEQEGIDVRLLHDQGPIKEQYRDKMIAYAEGERAKDPLCWVKKAFAPHQYADGTFKEDVNLVVTDNRRLDEIDWIYNRKVEEYLHTNGTHELEGAREQRGDMKCNVKLFLVERDNLADTDVLTHYCLGYAKGMNQTERGFDLINGAINNNDSVKFLQQKLAQLVQTFELEHIYS